MSIATDPAPARAEGTLDIPAHLHPTDDTNPLPPPPPAPASKRKPDFRLHPSVLRYAIPLSVFCNLPSNAGKSISVGVIIASQQVALGRGSSALLVRPVLAGVGEKGWALPSLHVKFGTDQTLLEAVHRCVGETTGGQARIKEIVRFLGSGPGVIGPQSRRFDFLVTLHSGVMLFPLGAGVEGKWASAEEAWRTMKRLPESGGCDAVECGE